MNGVIIEWTNGRVWLKTQKPVSWGRSRSWTFCLITVFLCVYSVFDFGDIQGRVFIKENLADTKTVRYCFVTFYLNSPFSSISFSPKATSELSVRHKILFFCAFCFFSNRWKGGTNTATCKRKADTSVKHLHPSLSLFKQFSSHFIPLRKDTVSSRLGWQGGENTKTQSCRMDWSSDETQMCRSRVKKKNKKSNLKSHSKPVKENDNIKRLPVSKDCF